MEAWKTRVIEEYVELRVKLTALIAFGKTDTWKALDIDEQNRLSNQVSAMETYRAILKQRIEAW